MLDLSTLQCNLNALWLGLTHHLKLNPSRSIPTALALLLALRIFRARHRHRRSRTPRLHGPPSQSFVFGATEKLLPAPHVGAAYELWEKSYGPVYEVPATFGSRHVVLTDPKALAHFCMKDTTTYVQPAFQRMLSRRVFGDILISAEGEDHKRQRRVLSSAFSISAIRNLTPVFLDCAYKLKTEWDSSFESPEGLKDGVVIDVQKWMNFLSLDNIGNAGFSYDFGTLRNQGSPLSAAFDSFHKAKPSLLITLALLVGPQFPNIFTYIPNKRQGGLWEIASVLKPIAVELLDRANKDLENKAADRSILGVMIRSENASSNIRLSIEEITAQINMFILAGYETTAITLTWALIELARNPELQEIIRAELLDAVPVGQDPTYDQLHDLPHLDAFMCELLRIRPSEVQTMRVASEDDIIPLTQPIMTKSGKTIDSLFVKKGTVLRIPFAGVNRSEALWGPDAGKFDPARWLVSEEEDGVGRRRKDEVKGYRNLLTFSYGPRMCPARKFAVHEVKSVISVLVRNFSFEFPGGPGTEVGHHFLRPKIAGEEGTRVPLLVRKLT